MILAVDGRKVLTSQDFFAALQRKNAGDVATLTVLRDPLGARQTSEVPLRLEAE